MPIVTLDTEALDVNEQEMFQSIWQALKLPQSIGDESVTEMHISRLTPGSLSVASIAEHLPNVLNVVKDVFTTTFAEKEGVVRFSYQIVEAGLQISLSWQNNQ